ncbi:hypothetical protein [Mycolicibacterium tokaiense]|uniref:PASTA domain-containing protein n=1 Tax=Mycolicibacterium tokaiense TaxID=39695 RepID=A0A378TEN1_9MYCO|nr:hypothetical protein [Mycolicibacterium tokaiense]BBY86847.1 hypothetical protein MTOK_26290 [Mycolicibacterium tokaiense]STZ58647.1 Uncharacterised protein [Mycolicibacterium tokaiense]
MTVRVAMCAAAGLLLAAAPAAAEPTSTAPLPEPPMAGTQLPVDAIETLGRQGYDVEIEWVSGYPSNIPLKYCQVTNIDVHAAPLAYIMISCPPDTSQ